MKYPIKVLNVKRYGGGGAGRSKPAIKVNKVLVHLLINGLVRTQTLKPTPFG